MSVTIRVKASSAATTISGLRKAGGIINGTLAVAAGGNVLLEEVRQAVSLKDHTLQQLADLDHPYARRTRRVRGPEGRFTGGWTQNEIKIHRPKTYQVHSQSGEMLASLRGSLGSLGGVPVYKVDFNSNEHAEFVIAGTQFMLSRNVIEAVAGDRRVQRDMLRAVVDVLGRRLRLQVKR